MYSLLFLFVISFSTVLGYRRDDNNDDFDKLKLHKPPAKPHYNLTFFPPLRNYHINATPVTEESYPWIARVIHSTVNDYPHICTAVCLEQRIFITAARCIFRIKVAYTRILYDKKYMPALAFVTPTNITKQMFDDIGFIVVEKVPYVGSWPSIALNDTVKRTDDTFMWFYNLRIENRRYYVVGYASVKRFTYPPKTPYDLTLLSNVLASLDLCNKLTRFEEDSNDYWVPCYHSCTHDQSHLNASACAKFHAVEGGALVDAQTKKLVGIATWAAYTYLFNLPVGFSVPNSENFYTDYACAKKIRDHSQMQVRRANFNYQKFCE